MGTIEGGRDGDSAHSRAGQRHGPGTLDGAGLACLAALAEAGSFEGAAHLLVITQSAVSQRLRTLESNVGHPLVVRARPLRLTEPGKVLLRFARQMQVLRADAARELGATLARDERLPLAVNADSLATWVLPALDTLVHAGHHEGHGLELIVDDQDFTHDRLREGEVLGCVSSNGRALQGCLCQPLGAMRYIAVAAPAFIREQLPQGLTRASFPRVPFIVFNRKDDMQAQWVARAFGVRSPRLRERAVPSSEAGARAAAMGWGVAVLPELLAQPLVKGGGLAVLCPDVALDVALYWHHWKLCGSGRVGLMARINEAVLMGARKALRPPARRAVNRDEPRRSAG